MQMVVVKYISIMCFALFINCDKLMLQTKKEDTRIYDVSVCTSQCMGKNISLTLASCYNSCSITSKTQIERVEVSLDVELVCRNITDLVFRISNYENLENDTNVSENAHRTDRSREIPKIFVLTVYESYGGYTEEQTYLANNSLISVHNLNPNSTYNITVAVVAGNEVIINTKEMQFSTLPTEFIPGPISNITLVNLTTDENDRFKLKALVTWKPNEDRTCYYDVISFSTSGKASVFHEEIRQPKDLYSCIVEDLFMGSSFQVAVRGKHTQNLSIESEAIWTEFDTPSCFNWYNNNLTICPPAQPTGLQVEHKHLFKNIFSFNITWHKPELNPDFYEIRILDIDPTIYIDANSSMDPMAISMNVSWETSELFLPNVSLHGYEFELHLTAFSIGGKATAFFAKPLTIASDISGRDFVLELGIAIIAPIVFIVVVSLFVLMICHRRAKLKRYQERCKYFEELEKKAPADPNSKFEFSMKIDPILPSKERLNLLQLELENKLYINDDMEVDRDHVVLLEEVLGEGAFGLVRKGIVTLKDDKQCEVAIKMLKDNPSIDDIKAFRREIDVMKFVGEHPNIVGIIGHCTRDINEMLLLTEYCCNGNLLYYLRSEWQYLSKVSTQPEPAEISATELLSEKQPECVSNFDTYPIDKVSRYKNVTDNKLTESELADTITNSIITGQDNVVGPTQFVVNKSYDYNGPCTNSCKCLVDIIPRNECLKTNEFDYKHNNRIEIKSCKCRLKLSPKDDMCSSVFLENKNYYKFYEPDKLEQSLSSNEQLEAEPKNDRLNSDDLLRMAKQVALGMEYLSRNRVVHRDLAARNVLVCEYKTVKIADFGLSRDIYQENIYKKTGNGKLPIKWLALESMTHQVYTTHSDVWSYGILLYEIVTLGATPYPLVPTNRLLKLLKTGYRMAKPINCSHQLYDLMLSCWCINPTERPTFLDICQALDDLLAATPPDQTINMSLMENNKRSKSLSEESYLKPI